MSSVVPFPRYRHRAFVLKHAANVARMGHAAGERYLAQQLQVQRATMEKRGIAQDLIEREVKRLELAIRAESGRMVFASGGAA